jgi:hypothetical protein
VASRKEGKMAIILFRKGTGAPVKVSPFGFEHSLAIGEYFLTQAEAIAQPEPEKAGVVQPLVNDPEEEPNQELEEGLEEKPELEVNEMESLRKKAKAIGVKNYWRIKDPETLREKIEDAEQSEG